MYFAKKYIIIMSWFLTKYLQIFFDRLQTSTEESG